MCCPALKGAERRFSCQKNIWLDPKVNSTLAHHPPLLEDDQPVPGADVGADAPPNWQNDGVFIERVQHLTRIQP